MSAHISGHISGKSGHISGKNSEKNAFLAGLTGEDFALLRSYLSQKELRAGTTLHRYGERVDEIVFPHSGLVSMTLPLQEGRGVGVALIGSEGMVGGFAAAALAPASSDSEVLVAGSAIRISASAFRYALDNSPTFRRHAAQFDHSLIAQGQRTALCNAAHSVESRICRCLLEVQDRIGGDRIPFTQDTLARLLGVRRTTVTLVAGRLEMLGALNCRRGSLQIVDRTALERCCCECYGHGKDYALRLRPDHGHSTPTRLAIGSRSTGTEGSSATPL
jgi:CRP-like cAMP-binding protein